MQQTKKKLLLLLACLAIVATGAAFKLFSKKDTDYKPLVAKACQDASYFLDIRTDTLVSETYQLKKRESLKSVLQRNGVKGKQYEAVQKASKQIIQLGQVASGLTCHLLKTSNGDLRYAVVERNPYTFVVVKIDQEQPLAYNFTKTPVYAERDVAGVLTGDLYTTFKELDIPRNLIHQIDKVYDYTFNLYKLRNGDTIRIKYEEMLVDGQPVKATELKACLLTNKGNNYYAISYKLPGDKEPDFYDEKGQALKRTFLEKPLKYGRLSSKFNKNRVHPVLKITKAHLGTDFAAPHGTPIIATADGVIDEIGFKKYNGNYVRVKHDKVYSTQYLHMSKFVKGMKKGTRVKQGEVIGYVGSTGLATGPHVCYRFWKKGQQVDPFRENLKFAQALDGNAKKEFQRHFNSIHKDLYSIQPWNSTNLLKEAVAAAR